MSVYNFFPFFLEFCIKCVFSLQVLMIPFLSNNLYMFFFRQRAFVEVLPFHFTLQLFNNFWVEFILNLSESYRLFSMSCLVKELSFILCFVLVQYSFSSLFIESTEELLTFSILLVLSSTSRFLLRFQFFLN